VRVSQCHSRPGTTGKKEPTLTAQFDEVNMLLVQPNQASGPNYAAARAAYLQSIPDGWISLGITVDA